MPVNDYIRVRRGTSTEWSSANPVLADGEIGFDATNKIFKVGDGNTAWNSLLSVGGAGGSIAGSQVTTGTIADARLSNKVNTVLNLYLWTNFR